MNSKLLFNWLIVLATVAVVVVPIFGGSFRLSDEIARWHLAAATNALELGNGDMEASLLKAREASENVEVMRDYWILRVVSSLKGDRTELPSIIESAVAKNRQFSDLGFFAAAKLELEDEFLLVVKVFEESLTPQQRAAPEVLNLMAYNRSLAGEELDTALADIRLALETIPENPSLAKLSEAVAYRDTKAWVLYQMGRADEAIEDADFAVEKTLELKRKADPFNFSGWWQEFAGELSKSEDAEATGTQDAPEGDGEPQASVESTTGGRGTVVEETTGEADSSKTDSSKTDAGSKEVFKAVEAAILQEGVLRYHRAMILEAIGESVKAEEDFQWLRKYNLPTDGSIH